MNIRWKEQLSCWYYTRCTTMQLSLGWVYLISPWICTSVHVSADVGTLRSALLRKKIKMMVVCTGRQMQWRGQGWNEKIHPGTAQRETTAWSWWRSQPWPSYTPSEAGGLCPKLGHWGAHSHMKQQKMENERQTDRRTENMFSIPHMDFGWCAFQGTWDVVMNRQHEVSQLNIWEGHF